MTSRFAEFSLGKGGNLFPDMMLRRALKNLRKSKKMEWQSTQDLSLNQDSTALLLRNECVFNGKENERYVPLLGSEIKNAHNVAGFLSPSATTSTSAVHQAPRTGSCAKLHEIGMTSGIKTTYAPVSYPIPGQARHKRAIYL